MEDATIHIDYQQTGRSTHTDSMGMREMQANVYAHRNQQYLLVKAPPASGKSRAMMYVALYKMKKQHLKKTIVAVPEKTIGGSFKETHLKITGFFADWRPAPYYDLCSDSGYYGDDRSKVKRFIDFLTDPHASILICTHATLRFAMSEVEDSMLNDCFVGIDEFHHTSADAESGLGEVVRRLIANTNAHILAMTGSYFRGDGVPVLRAEDEARFYPVTYNYYQQLNGYQYLKNLQIGYKFYQGKYLDVLKDVLDTTRKTIIHIPAVNSRATTGLGKWGEVEEIIKVIGEIVHIDEHTTVKTVRTSDGRLLKVADLVEDAIKERSRLQNYLRNIRQAEDMDIIIALGTAKEGFDWQWCDTCLTIGVRGSLTEIVQIIGRCTRDCPGKTNAQFINLIAQPDAAKDNVVVAVNDFLKAITASLLMEQVMAPSWNFKTVADDNHSTELGKHHSLVIEGLKPLSSEKTKLIVAAQLDDLKATILQNDMIVKAIGTDAYAETINKVLIPKVVREKYPDLTEEEVEEVSQYLIVDTIAKGAKVVEKEDKRFLQIANRFINIDQLNINIIESINPFQRAYEVMSKSINKEVLKVIQDTIAEQHYDMSLEEAVLLCKEPYHTFKQEHPNLEPSLSSPILKEQRLAQAYQIVKNEIIRRKQGLR
ncbi:MAG: DEAD/DEAH box helicase family protein [Paludibacteraceae bacterium]|nr:DEAD/DEAH box helicase family protein [Paludibacteraceae bacterium]